MTLLTLTTTLTTALLLSHATAQIQIPLPSPAGPYPVHQTLTNLTDHARPDPYVPSFGKRNLGLSIFTPVSPRSCTRKCAVPYMPPKAAAYLNAGASRDFGIPEGVFAGISMELCCETRTSSASTFPVVLFSPGLQGSRLMYSYMAATIASYGYVVATIDHTFESPVVEFPDGSIVPGLNDTFFDPRTPGPLDKALKVRVDDARFVLGKLGQATVIKGLGLPGGCGLDVKRAGFVGHSFGGASALAALAVDKRFTAGMNMDGRQYGDLSGLRREQAVVFFGRAAPNSHNMTDEPTWATGYAAAKGWKRVIGLKESGHSSFGDFALLLKLAGFPASEDLKFMMGTLDGQRSFEVIVTYVQSFLGLALKGEKTKLFDGANNKFPEMVVEGGK